MYFQKYPGRRGISLTVSSLSPAFPTERRIVVGGAYKRKLKIMEEVANTLHLIAVVVTENTDQWKKLLLPPVKMYYCFETKSLCSESPSSLFCLMSFLTYLFMYLQSCIFTLLCLVLLQNGTSERVQTTDLSCSVSCLHL